MLEAMVSIPAMLTLFFLNTSLTSPIMPAFFQTYTADLEVYEIFLDRHSFGF